MSLDTPLRASRSEYRPGERFTDCLYAFIDREGPVDPHKVTRRILKIGAAIVSAGAKVPFFPIAMKLGPTLGPISAACNASGFFVLEYWAAQNTIDDFLGPKTQAQIDLTQDKKAVKWKLVCRNVVVMSISSILALSSQINTALPGISYNEERFKIAAGVVLLVAGALIPIRSLQLSLNRLSVECRGSRKAKVAHIKAKIIDLLLTNQRLFTQQNPANKRAFIQEIETIRTNQDDPTIKAKQYSGTLLKEQNQSLTPIKKIAARTFNYTGLGTGAALAGLFEYVSADYAFYTSKTQLLDNDYLAATLATLTVTSTAYLFAASIVTTTQRIFNAMGRVATGVKVRNLGWQLRPKLSFALTAVGLFINVFATAPTFVIFGDFYANDPPIQREFFRDTTCASLLLLLFTSTLDIINDVVTFSVVRGSEEKLQILELAYAFQQFAHLIEKSPPREFIGYLESLDDPTKASILARINLSAQQLTELAKSLKPV